MRPATQSAAVSQINGGFSKRLDYILRRPSGRPIASLNINPMYQLRQPNEFRWEVAGTKVPRSLRSARWETTFMKRENEASDAVLGNLFPPSKSESGTICKQST